MFKPGDRVKIIAPPGKNGIPRSFVGKAGTVLDVSISRVIDHGGTPLYVNTLVLLDSDTRPMLFSHEELAHA